MPDRFPKCSHATGNRLVDVSLRGLSQWEDDQTPGTTKAHPGYHTHDVVNGGKARIILTALVMPSEVMESQAVRDLLWHRRFRWHLWPWQVTGDTTWHSREHPRG